MRTFKYFLADKDKHKERVHQLDFIGAFFQAKFKNRVFVKLDSIYAEYFPEYSNDFGIALRLLKSMQVMTNSGELFDDYLTEWLLEIGFIQYQCKMSIYYNDAPDGTIIFVLSYVYDCIYWYNSEDLGKQFVDDLRNIFHMNVLGYAHWFMSIIISQMKDHFISSDQARYVTYILAEYMDNDTVKTSTNFYKTTLPSDIIFTKCDASTSDY